MEIGDLTETAIAIVGGVLTGAVQDTAATLLTQVVTQRLATTDQGNTALELLREHPADSDRRQFAAGVLAEMALTDDQFAVALRDAMQGLGAATVEFARRTLAVGEMRVKSDARVAGRDVHDHSKRTNFGGINVVIIAVVALFLIGGGTALVVSLASPAQQEAGGQTPPTSPAAPRSEDGRPTSPSAPIGSATSSSPGSASSAGRAPGGGGRASGFLQLEPDFGPAETVVVVRGSGFEPGERVRVTLSAYSHVLRDTTANSGGSIEVEVVIPDGFGMAGKTYQIRAEGLTTEFAVNTYFRLTER